MATVCVVVTLLLLGPRAAILVSWIGWSERWEAAFDSFLVPFLGFLLFPWITLAWVLCAPDGVDGLDWLLLALATLADVGSMVGGGGYGRTRAAAAGQAR
jgi:hypothetical protein